MPNFRLSRALRFYADQPLAFAADLIGVAALFIMLWGGLLAASVLS